MELARAEAALKKPPNYGEILFRKFQDPAYDMRKTRPPKPIVMDHLQLQPVVTGPLDGTLALSSLNEEEQCEFFSHYPKCESLILRGWEEISDNVLRCISFTMGEQLKEIDFSYSNVKLVDLEVLLPRMRRLKKCNFSHCPLLNGACMNILARLTPDIEELLVDHCALFESEPLMWLAGLMGFQGPKLSCLTVLDLSNSPIDDKGLTAVSTCNKRLKYLNLNDCHKVTDSSLTKLIKCNKHLLLISLRNVGNITDKTVCCIANNCSEIRSLNLSQCVLVGNKGVLAIGNKCSKLQALNISGLNKLDESPLCALTNTCLGLQMLNVTGISAITVNGLNALIEGMNQVALAQSFVGIRPVDNHVEKKLQGHLDMIKDNAILHIKKEKKKERAKREMKEKAQQDYIIKCANVIKRYMYAYKIRMVFYNMWQTRLSKEGAITIQRVWRGVLGRKRFNKLMAEWKLFLSNAPYAIMIQKSVRGHHVRVNYPLVSQAIRDMYAQRCREAEAAVSVRFQANARRFLAFKRAEAWREVCGRRDIDEANAILILQMLGRRYNSKRLLFKLRFEKLRRDQLEYNAASKIQSWYVSELNRYLSKLSGKELQAAMNKTWRSTLLLQQAYRGYRGREYVNKLRIERASRNYAAIKIQKVFRSARILYWKDMRLNVIAAYALDRQYIERRESVAASRLRYRAYVLENRRDSASDSDDPPDQDADAIWLKKTDKKANKPFWVNEATQEVTYDEPVKLFNRELSMLGLRVRVYWIVQQMWYEGTISDFHKRKVRHRIDYDDGDHEWLNILEENERVQVQLEDGSWIMALMYKAPGDLEEGGKIDRKSEEEAFKKQALTDANQWKLIQEDHGAEEQVIYISTRTGEIRVGTIDATNWVVHNDNFGYPCFYNLATDETVYEDPRFIHDTDKDHIAEREYIMQEARYALYFCKEYWETYRTAVENDDKRAQHRGLLQVSHSPKVKHLASFLLRARTYTAAVSVIDKPLNKVDLQDIELMEYIMERMKEMMDMADVIKKTNNVSKHKWIKYLEQKHSGKQYFCGKCGEETQRQWDYCENCGKRQIIM